MSYLFTQNTIIMTILEWIKLLEQILLFLEELVNALIPGTAIHSATKAKIAKLTSQIEDAKKVAATQQEADTKAAKKA